MITEKHSSIPVEWDDEQPFGLATLQERPLESAETTRGPGYAHDEPPRARTPTRCIIMALCLPPLRKSRSSADFWLEA